MESAKENTADGRSDVKRDANDDMISAAFMIGGKFRMRFRSFIESGSVQSFIEKADFCCYQQIVEFLMPKVTFPGFSWKFSAIIWTWWNAMFQVLRPIPNSLTQSIRNFAKCMEGWMTSAMKGVAKEVKDIKVAAVKSFGQTLRRYTGLNHLAQAARAVLQNSSQINQVWYYNHATF